MCCIGSLLLYALTACRPLQKEATLRRVKRLVVMDMDSTLIQQEVSACRDGCSEYNGEAAGD